MTRRRLQAEFAVFYLIVPVAIAVFMPPQWMFAVLFAFTLVGAGLLQITPGFRWRDLIRGQDPIGWPLVLGFAAITAGVCALTVLWLRPEAFLGLLRERPQLLLLIFALYPILSALPQEIVFRALFFRRYGGLMPGRRLALVINAGVFSLAHLLYWNAPALILTFLGGLVFAWVYERRRNFPAAVLLHALAGCILFALGLGVFFYTGAIQRPF